MAIYGISIVIDKQDETGEIVEQVCYGDGEFDHVTGDGNLTKLLKALREAAESNGVDMNAWQWG